MMRTMGIWTGVLVGLVAAAAGVAQEKGTWLPTSKTAKSITGPVTIGNERLTMNFSSFAVAEIRELKADEVLAAFDGANAAHGAGHLFRLSIPAAKQFLHKNTMCAGEETQWMVTFAEGKTLNVAFFSGAQIPVLTPEAMANSTVLCGTYAYTR